MDQLRWDLISFSGRKFFFLTQETLLTVRSLFNINYTTLGTHQLCSTSGSLVLFVYLQVSTYIFTYELLLLSSTKEDETNSAPSCNF